MKRVLVLAAVSEAATGVALLIVPSLVGQLLFGEELIGVAIPVARVLGIALIALGVACWPGHAAGRHVDLRRGRHAVSRFRRLRRWFDRHTTVASGRPARDPDGASDSVGARNELLKRRPGLPSASIRARRGECGQVAATLTRQPHPILCHAHRALAVDKGWRGGLLPVHMLKCHTPE
jgi:hypothetical protein